MGSYALRGNIFDVYVMVVFGALGYLMKSFGFSVIPTVLGLILGPVAESGLNNMIAISHGQNIVLFLVQRPHFFDPHSSDSFLYCHTPLIAGFENLFPD